MSEESFSPEMTVWTTRQILDGARPILLVSHELDGDWQFLPGTFVETNDGVAAHLRHILDKHPDVHEVADLPSGWGAARDFADGPWRRFTLE